MQIQLSAFTEFRCIIDFLSPLYYLVALHFHLHVYLKNVFVFSQKENGMDLKDRMAFACRYLSDSKVYM